MFNWSANDTEQYLEPFNFVEMPNWIVWNRTVWSFNCVQASYWCLVELLELNGKNENI